MRVPRALACPACGSAATGWQRKLAVGPARGMTCAGCATTLSTPWWSVACVAPLLAAIAVAGGAWWRPAFWLCLAAGFLATCVLHLAFVPLVRR